MDSSDLQMVGYAIYAVTVGLGIALEPEFTLSALAPLTNLIESVTGLSTLAAPSILNQTGPSISAMGGIAATIGLYYVLALLSGDQKFKQNSVTGRFSFAALCFYVCRYTPYGSGLLAALGLGDFLTAIPMGLTVGFLGPFTSASKGKRA